jgi:DNA replication protein DnaC
MSHQGDLIPSVPRRFRHATFDNYTPTTDRQAKAVETLRQAVRTCYVEFRGPVVLYGGVGTGKTHLACALLQETARDGIVGDETRGELADHLRRFRFLRWQDAADDDQLRVLRDPDVVLLLDDLAKPETKAEERAIRTVIGDRYDAGRLSLIVTTNLTPAELRASLGDRLTDRLGEGALLLRIDGDSHRASIRGADLLAAEIAELDATDDAPAPAAPAAPAGPPARLIELKQELQRRTASNE